MCKFILRERYNPVKLRYFEGFPIQKNPDLSSKPRLDYRLDNDKKAGFAKLICLKFSPKNTPFGVQGKMVGTCFIG